MTALRPLVERLVADLGRNLVVEWRRDGDSVDARLFIDGEFAAGAGVPADWPVEDAATHIVGVFQDDVIEAAGGEPRPPCAVPGHPHPAVLRRTGRGPRLALPARGPACGTLRG